MLTAVDSIVVQHSVRAGKKAVGAGEATILTRCMKQHGLRIAVDPRLAIVDEWKQTAGAELVNVLFTLWVDLGAIEVLGSLGHIPHHTNRRLREAGLDGTLDRLLVKIALKLVERFLVSEDSDFWDPADTSRPGRVGDLSAPVAALLASELEIHVLTLPHLLALLKERSAS